MPLRRLATVPTCRVGVSASRTSTCVTPAVRTERGMTGTADQPATAAPQPCRDCQWESHPDGCPKHAPDCPRLDKERIIDHALGRCAKSTEADDVYSAPVVERMNHLIQMVQAHQTAHGVPEADADFTVGWEPSGWWLSIVCPGHYAFEHEDRPDLFALLDEAVAYYGGGVPLWDGNGCQEHHLMEVQP